MTRNRLALGVFAVGAVLSGVWAFYNLQPLMDLFWSERDFGGGSIGGLSDSVDALQYALAPLIAFAISRRVRESGGFARGLRRAHVATTGTIVVLVVLFVVATALGRFTHGIDGLWFALLTAAIAGGALWLPLQAFFTAGFLSLLIKRRHAVS